MWAVRDVDDWPEQNRESRGKRQKLWLRAPDGSLWLFKYPRPSRPTEPAVEWFVLELARIVGVRSAEAVVGRRMDAGQEVRGSLIRKFLDSRQVALHSGSLVLRGADPQYDPTNRWSQTPERVRAALAALPEASDQLVRMVGVLALDAWVGNADRHQDNWSVEESRAGVRSLSPMYDPATCLGVELKDGHALLLPGASAADLDSYASRCSSGFGDGSGPLLMDELVMDLDAWPEWRSGIGSWLDAFSRALGDGSVDALLDQADDGWWPPARKRFARRLLDTRLERLARRAVPEAR